MIYKSGGEMIKRCPECGSWEAQCVEEEPQVGCGCARCANARLVLAEQIALQADKLADSLRACDREGIPAINSIALMSLREFLRQWYERKYA